MQINVSIVLAELYEPGHRSRHLSVSGQSRQLALCGSLPIFFDQQTSPDRPDWSVWCLSRLMHRNQLALYSITSSALASNGTVRSSAWPS